MVWLPPNHHIPSRNIPMSSAPQTSAGGTENRSWSCVFPRAATGMTVTLPAAWCALKLGFNATTECVHQPGGCFTCFPFFFFPPPFSSFCLQRTEIVRSKLLDLTLRIVPGVSYTKLLFFNRQRALIQPPRRHTMTAVIWSPLLRSALNISFSSHVLVLLFLASLPKRPFWKLACSVQKPLSLDICSFILSSSKKGGSGGKI